MRYLIRHPAHPGT